ncbi:MAG: response regulator [Candidatus Zixiibacteriota bacterium]
MPGKGHILVVDDELVIRSLLSEMLSEDGFSVATAEDGRRGLECIRQGGVDLVISDIHMPVMDGPQMLQELKRTDPCLPVIVLDSIPDRSVAESQAESADACLSKPFNLQELRDTIGRLHGHLDTLRSITGMTE